MKLDRRPMLGGAAATASWGTAEAWVPPTAGLAPLEWAPRNHRAIEALIAARRPAHPVRRDRDRHRDRLHRALRAPRLSPERLEALANASNRWHLGQSIARIAFTTPRTRPGRAGCVDITIFQCLRLTPEIADLQACLRRNGIDVFAPRLLA